MTSSFSGSAHEWDSSAGLCAGNGRSESVRYVALEDKGRWFHTRESRNKGTAVKIMSTMIASQ